MPITVKHLKEPDFKDLMVIFPLKQYEILMEYLEDIKVRLCVKERINELNISHEEVEKKLERNLVPNEVFYFL